MVDAVGQKLWVISGGHIPLESNGCEPEFTSRDEFSVLNNGPDDTCLRIHIFYSDREPVGPYELKVRAGRMRCVRFNDLIFPEAMPLDVDFAAVIEADQPVVAQFARVDTGNAEKAWLATTAFAQ